MLGGISMRKEVAAITVIALLVPSLGAADPLGPEEPRSLIEWLEAQVPGVSVQDDPLGELVDDNFCGGFVFLDQVLEIPLPKVDGEKSILRTVVGTHDKEFVENSPNAFLEEVVPEIMPPEPDGGAPEFSVQGTLGYFFLLYSTHGTLDCQEFFDDER